MSTIPPDNEAPGPRLPLVLSWGEPGKPLPIRPVRVPPRGRSRTLLLDVPPSLATGPDGQAFDFSTHVQRLCADIIQRCEPLRHVDVTRLLFCITQARSGRSHGLQARVTPLRFRNGQLVRRRRGTTYQVQRYIVGACDMLYLVTFCLPRFLDQDFDDKLITLFHELYHISPAFDGDLRRHDGRYQIHSHSKRGYDQLMAQLAREYLSTDPDPALLAFLRLNFEQLRHRHGQVVGVMVPRPKLIPLPSTRGKKPAHVREATEDAPPRRQG